MIEPTAPDLSQSPPLAEDPVDESSLESFPASDAPSWIAGKDEPPAEKK